MSSYQRICLVHYHEIGLKGRNRSSFETRLVRNLEGLLRSYPIAEIKRISGRILVLLSSEADYALVCQVEEAIRMVPGVARVSCGYRCDRVLDDMCAAASDALQDVGEFEAFKVAARRSHTDFPTSSMEMNQIVGAYLCDSYPHAKVKMKDPDVVVGVEVIQGASYVYARSLRGIGGLPVGSSGRLVCLLSSGIDSPVATWKMARRGAVCIGVHFSGRPAAEGTSEFLVDDIAHVLERTGCIARVYVVPFGEYQRQIAASVPPSLRVIMYRRLMFKVAQEVACKEHARGLVTGESLGQVASQTIDNIAATDEAVDMPVLRPLIGTDKLEIIEQAEKLGTFVISSQDATDCCTLFMPRNPETHAKMDAVLHAEESLPVERWIAEILEDVEVRDYFCPAYKKPQL
ncbi:MAG: tRNA 4-thiouridine(8) synthase ThiI [Eggerthellaceae bacterium]|nr:tRNA 4-thiouridine(8) synthase ThiI [Eggerthellaceae bacterium]